MLTNILIATVAIATGLSTLIYAKQEALIFHPHTLPADHTFAFPVPFEEVVVDSSGVGIHTLLFPKENSEGVVGAIDDLSKS